MLLALRYCRWPTPLRHGIDTNTLDAASYAATITYHVDTLLRVIRHVEAGYAAMTCLATCHTRALITLRQPYRYTHYHYAATAGYMRRYADAMAVQSHIR